MTEPSSSQNELRHVLRTLWRRKWPLLLCVIALPALTWAFTSRIKKTYQSSAVVQVQGAAVDTTLFTPTPSISQPEAIAATAKLTQTSQVGAPAARLLGLKASAVPSLLKEVTVTEDDTSGFVTITTTDRSASRSAAIANAFARAVVALRSSQAQGQVNRTVTAVAQRLAQLPAAEATARAQLSDQLQRLRAVAAAQVSNAQIIQFASPPTSPASPKSIRDTALALVLGLLLGVGVAFLLDRLDRRIPGLEDLQEITKLPLLAAIPGSAFARRDVAAELDEAFQTLRISLTYFNVDRPLKSVIVTSAGPGEGKTTVAVNLAMSFARSGKDVILLDTDLRRSSLLPVLGIDGGTASGLSAVLVNVTPLSEGMLEVPTFAGRLRVLPAGLPPPNPSELLSSVSMASLLAEAAEMVDIVVVDSSPLLAVSDSVPLLRQVSGVVLLARMGHTKRDALHRFREIVGLGGGNVLGVVATDTPEREGYGYTRTGKDLPEPARPRPVETPAREEVRPTKRIRVAEADAGRGDQ